MVTRFITNTLFSTPLFPYWLVWQDFWSMWSVLERQADLEQLVSWAKRKRLTGVRNYYRRLLLETEMLLAHKQMRFRRLVWWVRALNLVYRSINPKSEYYPKGGAAKYRLGRQ